MTSVLLVDDHVDSCSALARLITGAGVEAFCTPNGAEALRFLALNPVDLAIVDVMMPGIDGIELLRRVRANPGTSNLPVVLYTAALNTEIRERALREGATDYWVKSRIDFDEINSRLAKWLPAGREPRPAPFDRPLV